MSNSTLEQQFTASMEQVNTLLKNLDTDTFSRIINMMNYTQRPIEGFEDTALMITALFQVAPENSVNPIFVAVNMVKKIQKIAGDNLELLSYILDDLQQQRRELVA